MKRSILIFGVLILTAAALVFWGSGLFTKERRVYKIGILSRGTSTSYKTSIDSFRVHMAKLGYQEGKNVLYDIRFVDAREDLPKTVQEFISQGVDIIHTYSTPATQEAYKETKDMTDPIPVVFGSMGDPIVAGVIKDVNHPGTNVTGVVSLSTQLTANRLELLKEVDPQIKKVAFIHSAKELKDAASQKSIEVAQEAAKNLDIELVFYEVKSSSDHEKVAKNITRKHVDGMTIAADSLVFSGLKIYATQALKERMPFSIFDLSQISEQGALVGFGPDYTITGEQSALLVHQILQGRSPGQIPIETPRKLIFMVNLKTARSIGVELNQDFINKADIVIE